MLDLCKMRLHIRAGIDSQRLFPLRNPFGLSANCGQLLFELVKKAIETPLHLRANM
jgi:hypothetical protein